MSPITTRIFLGLTLLLAIAVACFSIQGIQSGQHEAWATLAASLAVITSMISAWGAQRVVEMEEQKLEPYPYLQFDLTSRYQLILIKITNFGGGIAHNVKLSWDNPLRDLHGNEINFKGSNSSDEITIILPGQHISKIVDSGVQFFKREGNHLYSGSISFQDSKGRKKSHRFILDADSYKESPLFDNEVLKTHYELQKLPEHLQTLTKEVAKIAAQLKCGQNAD